MRCGIIDWYKNVVRGSFIVDDNEFLSFRYLGTATTRHTDAIEVDTGLQPSAAILAEVPLDGVSAAGRHAAL